MIFTFPLFLPTPSARRATDPATTVFLSDRISTHALREEGDPVQQQAAPVVQISTHALREEGDGPIQPSAPGSARFLPTPSARRATRWCTRHSCGSGFLPTPSARRATQSVSGAARTFWNFYPRPPRGGRPQSVSGAARTFWNFYPRPPRGGRRFERLHFLHRHHFYPRPPRGGRLNVTKGPSKLTVFLPTPSARRATRSGVGYWYSPSLFLPTPSARRATT